jgi:Ubiquitin-binding domain
MGGCLGRNRGGGRSSNSAVSEGANRANAGMEILKINTVCTNTKETKEKLCSADGSVRKNHPLCQEVIRWKSDIPLTNGQLRSKRDEFWDTAPAFDGRKEIWDALRAAATAYEACDFELAQAILDGANISVPNGIT